MSSGRLRAKLSADFDPYVQTLGAYYAQWDWYQGYIETLGETLRTEEVTDLAFMRTEASIIYEIFTHSSHDLSAELRLLPREYAFDLLNM